MHTRRLIIVLALLWLVGNVIRIPILAIPPIIPFLRSDLGMSGTEIGVLSGIPMILFAIAAIPGSAIVARIGAVQALLWGLLITAVAGALRGAAPTTLALFAATIVMGAGIAVTQPALPVIVRQWLPDRIGLGTATYSNGMIAGCIVAVALTLPVIMPLTGESWRWSLALWSIPVLATLGLLAVFLVQTGDKAPAAIGSLFSLSGFKSSLIWKIGLMFGSNNCVYFGTNAFLPGYLIDAGLSHLVTETLTAYNLAHLPGSFAVLAFAHRIERRAWPYICAGLLLLAGLGWLLFVNGPWIVGATALLGFASGVTLSTGLMLPPLLSSPSRIALTAAAMFTISYTLAMVGLVLGGIAWDITGRPAAAFVVLAVSTLPLILLTGTLRLHQDAGRE